MFPLGAVAAALALGTAATRAALTTINYNVSFPDTSAMLAYEPFSETSGRSWNTTFTGSEPLPPANTIGQGQSTTSTSHVGARVDLVFVGTNCFFEGSLSNGGKVQVLVDGTSQSNQASSTGLPSVRNLAYKEHNVSLVVQAGTVSVTGVTITLGLFADSLDAITKAASSPTVIPYANDTGDTTVMNPVVTSNYSTAWSPNSVLGGGGGSVQESYTRIGSNTTGSAATISLGNGNTYLRLSGSAAGDHGQYTVVIDPPPPGGVGSHVGRSWNWWTVPNTTLIATPLMPNTSYTLTFVVGEGGWSDVAEAELWSVGTNSNDTLPGQNAGGETKKSNVGAIVGGVVGGVGGAVVIGLIAWYFWRRNKRKSTSTRKTESGERYVIEGDDDDDDANSSIHMTAAQISPYPTPDPSTGTPSQGRSRRTPSGLPQSPGLRISNGDDEALGLTGPLGASSDRKRRAARRRTQLQTHEEVDAGPVAAAAVEAPASVAVPPRYDPSWAVSSTADSDNRVEPEESEAGGRPPNR